MVKLCDILYAYPNFTGCDMDLDYNILIVDDVVENIQVAMNILKEDSYNFSFAKSAKEALQLLRQKKFDLILLDIMMPEMDGYEACSLIKSDPALMDIPVIFLTAKADVDSMERAFEVGGVDFITKPFHPNELLARVRTHLELHKAKELLKRHNLTLQAKIQRQKERVLSELEENQKEMIELITELVESVSDETGKHVRRVAEYSRLLATHHPALGPEDVEIIYHASPMHDIGKIAVPYEILHKEGPLTPEEYEIMKTHTTKAHEYLKNSKRKFLKAADIIAYQHHEHWDGSGYPRGLKGEEIHLYGRIVALSDVFDALTHKRTYKKGWSLQEAADYILEQRGKQFDPLLVDIFQEYQDEFFEIHKI